MPRRYKNFLFPACLGVVALGSFTLAAASEPDHDAYTALHAWSVGQDPKALEVWTDRHLSAAQSAIDRLLSVGGPRTVGNTVKPFDEANSELTLAYNETFVVFSLDRDASMRDHAQLLSQKAASAATALSLNHDVYEALKAVPEENLEPSTRNLLSRSLLEFRLSGVDRNAAVRDQLQELQDKINQDSLEFYRNIANDVHRVVVPRAQLDGLPADFIARHPSDDKGNVTLTTEETDVGPIASFANSADLRHKIAVAYDQRAYPANRMVLINLLQARYELATLLGYKSFADFDLADQMIGSSEKAKTFLAEVDNATREPAAHEYRRLLKFAQSREPSIRVISEADWRYWIEQYRRSIYQFDAQSVRAYFPYDEVQAGVLRTAGHMFHVEFKPISGSTLWDPSVSEYAVIDHGKKVGIIYLDMHPRDGKDKGNSAAPLVPGVRGKQLPEGVLMCNFPGGVAGDAGLMEYANVVTFIHEFGHLMHHILGGQGPWAMQEGENVERDFVEAPSQMLETFFSDPRVLDSFARRLDTEEPIPAELVQHMNEASAFGRALSWRRQLLFADYALQLHDAAPSTLDFDQLFLSDSKRFTQIEEVEGNHRYASFMHLPNYGAKYYTYVLDKVIALDFFDQFDKTDLLDGPAAMRFRHAVLDPGSSRPAEQLVQDFLGRPENLEAFKDWLNLEFQAGQPGAHVHF